MYFYLFVFCYWCRFWSTKFLVLKIQLKSTVSMYIWCYKNPYYYYRLVSSCAVVTDVTFLGIKQRTLKHIPCGLFWKTRHSQCENHLNTPYSSKKQSQSKGEKLKLSGFWFCNTDNWSLSGVASQLKKVNPHVISLHCLCHKLAPK